MEPGLLNTVIKNITCTLRLTELKFITEKFILCLCPVDFNLQKEYYSCGNQEMFGFWF